MLLGLAGDDTLHLGADNIAVGGAGEDTFTVEDRGGQDTVIDDFQLGVDRLQVEWSSEFTDIYTSENGLHVFGTLNMTTMVTLSNFTLTEGDAFEIDFLDGNGDVDETVVFEDPNSEPPFALDAIQGTDDDDTLTGTDGDDVIFGEDGADTIDGGEGDDTLFSGSGALYYPETYTHSPGTVSTVGDDGDVLDGGAGDDTLWIGPETTATGGDGADTFRAFANVYEDGTPAARITDFDPDEDVLAVDFPVYAASGPVEAFGLEDAISRLTVSYDDVADMTLIAMDGVAIAAINGDRSDVSIAFHDDYSTSEDRWRDADGNEITAETGANASIILTAAEYTSVVGV